MWEHIANHFIIIGTLIIAWTIAIFVSIGLASLCYGIVRLGFLYDDSVASAIKTSLGLIVLPPLVVWFVWMRKDA